MKKYVVCESADGWSLHAPGSSDEAIARGEAPPLSAGEWTDDDHEIPDWAYREADVLSLADAGHGEMVAIESHGRYGVRCTGGGVWWPDDDAQTEIQDSEDPLASVLSMSCSQPMRGRWHS